MYKIPANTLFFGKNIVFVPECHSTNTLLQELAQKTNQPEGTLVITNRQTQGRGQRGNTWEAQAEKNLTFSLLLKPHFLPARDQFFLNMVVSLGIMDFLGEKLRHGVKIKWPNDLMSNEKKITGILIENNLTSEAIQQSVVGIGLNVNQTSFSIATATSMRVEANVEFDLAAALTLLLEKLESRYLQLRSGKMELIKTDYLRNLYRIGEVHEFISAGTNFKGKLKGIDESGRLSISVNGMDRFFGLKEIAFAK